MAPKPRVTDAPVNLATRATQRAMKLPSWTTFQMAHWRQTTQTYKKKHNITPAPRKPGGTLFIFPSQDPYSSTQRMEFRAVHENVSWINRAIRIMVASVVGSGYTTIAKPRSEDEQMSDEQLDEWKETTRFSIPWADDMIEGGSLTGAIGKDGEEKGGWTVAQIEKFVQNLSVKLDLQSHEARAYRYTLEQGQCGIMMLPELKYNDETGELDDSDKDENASYVMPELLRTIRPEHHVRSWLNMDTGEMSSLQIIGIGSRGGRLPVERLIWFTSDYNLELNSDYYGESRILPLLDTGKVMVILYGKDFTEAAQYTWHQPKIFQVQIPPRDYKNVTTVLKAFLNKANNSAGRDIAVTQSIELISGQSNTGDINGLIAMDDHLIDQVAGYFNIPPFLLSKGKAGNLGGNAQAEEVDAFLNVEVRPQQEIIETFIEKQFYDRILQILFHEDDVDKIPIKLTHNLVKPEIQTLFDKEQYEVMLDMMQRKILSEDKLLKRLNLEPVKREVAETGTGQDPNPTKDTWPSSHAKKRNPHWERSERLWLTDKNKWEKAPAWSKRPEIKVENREF